VEERGQMDDAGRQDSKRLLGVMFGSALSRLMGLLFFTKKSDR